VDNYRFY